MAPEDSASIITESSFESTIPTAVIMMTEENMKQRDGDRESPRHDVATKENNNDDDDEAVRASDGKDDEEEDKNNNDYQEFEKNLTADKAPPELTTTRTSDSDETDDDDDETSAGEDSFVDAETDDEDEEEEEDSDDDDDDDDDSSEASSSSSEENSVKDDGVEEELDADALLAFTKRRLETISTPSAVPPPAQVEHDEDDDDDDKTEGESDDYDSASEEDTDDEEEEEEEGEQTAKVQDTLAQGDGILAKNEPKVQEGHVDEEETQEQKHLSTATATASSLELTTADTSNVRKSNNFSRVHDQSVYEKENSNSASSSAAASDDGTSDTNSNNDDNDNDNDDEALRPRRRRDANTELWALLSYSKRRLELAENGNKPVTTMSRRNVTQPVVVPLEDDEEIESSDDDDDEEEEEGTVEDEDRVENVDDDDDDTLGEEKKDAMEVVKRADKSKPNSPTFTQREEDAFLDLDDQLLEDDLDEADAAALEAARSYGAAILSVAEVSEGSAKTKGMAGGANSSSSSTSAADTKKGEKGLSKKNLMDLAKEFSPSSVLDFNDIGDVFDFKNKGSSSSAGSSRRSSLHAQGSRDGSVTGGRRGGVEDNDEGIDSVIQVAAEERLSAMRARHEASLRLLHSLQHEVDERESVGSSHSSTGERNNNNKSFLKGLFAGKNKSSDEEPVFMDWSGKRVRLRDLEGKEPNQENSNKKNSSRRLTRWVNGIRETCAKIDQMQGQHVRMPRSVDDCVKKGMRGSFTIVDESAAFSNREILFSTPDKQRKGFIVDKGGAPAATTKAT